MDWGMERIYPNLYIVLLGPAAQTRKSTALRIGEDLVKDLQIPMIGQDNSPEAVIREIKRSVRVFNEGNVARFQSAVSCFASELAVFLGRQNTEFQAYMTDWYDSPAEWKRTTKHQGVDDISGMCFNLIGAMAPDWIPFVFSPESIGGGFTSRVVFVSETRKAKTIANPNKFPIDKELRLKLLHDLERVSSMVGGFTMSPAAEAFYEAWYEKDDAGIQKGDFPVPDRNFHTYCGRRGTLLRKISMAVAASQSDELVVELNHIQEALRYMTAAERNMPGTFSAVGRSALSAQLTIVTTMIAARGTVDRSDLMRELHKDISVTDLEEIERTLEASQIIRISKDTMRGRTTYEWLG